MEKSRGLERERRDGTGRDWTEPDTRHTRPFRFNSRGMHQLAAPRRLLAPPAAPSFSLSRAPAPASAPLSSRRLGPGVLAWHFVLLAVVGWREPEAGRMTRVPPPPAGFIPY